LIVAAFGFFNAGILITAQSIIQVRVPEHLLGRALSLFGIVGGLGSASALPIGALGDEFGLRYPIGFVGLILVGLTLIMVGGAQPLRWLGQAQEGDETTSQDLFGDMHAR
jgi:MFS family permease